jgi:glycosyltransferase involved in cell wall biosynthesis
MPKHRLKIGYLLRKFPVLSETFILNEMLALEERGIRLHAFSLERSNAPRFHENLPKLKAEITYLPQPLQWNDLWKYGVQAARLFGKNYVSALTYAVRHLNPSLVWRFLQGCYVAHHSVRLGLNHLHSHFANRPTTVAFFASWMAGIPYSFTAHAADIYRKRMDPKALGKKIEKAKFVVTISDFNKNFLANLSGKSNDKIVRIYNGIDLNEFVPNGTLPSRQKPFTFLCVSRLVEKKGVSILVEACKHLRDRNVPFECWIVGSGVLRKKLEAMIHGEKLQRHVKLLGPRTQHEVLKRYRSSDLYVLPCIAGADGNRDGLPVSIIEALACGLPVVTTPMTGIPEVVRDKHNGLLVSEGDSVALSQAIESLIHDTSLYQSLSSQARASVTLDFDLAKSTETLYRLFENGTL